MNPPVSECKPRQLRRPHARDIEVGQSIRHYRKAAKMSMKVLADRLGVSHQQVEKYERGLNRIAAGRLMEVADILNVPLSAFFPPQARAANGEMSAVEASPFMNGDGAKEDTQAVEAFLLVKAFFEIDDPARRLDALAYVRSLAEGKVP